MKLHKLSLLLSMAFISASANHERIFDSNKEEQYIPVKKYFHHAKRELS